MLEKSFIKFSPHIPVDSEQAIPLVIGGEGISFFVDAVQGNQNAIFSVVKANGTGITGLSEDVSYNNGYAGQFFGDAAIAGMHINGSIFKSKIGDNKCVRIAVRKKVEIAESVSVTITKGYYDMNAVIGTSGYVEVPIRIPVGDSLAYKQCVLDVDFKGSSDSGFIPRLRDENGTLTDNYSIGVYGGTRGTINGETDENGYITLTAVFVGMASIGEVKNDFIPFTFSNPSETPNVIIKTDGDRLYSNLLMVVDNKNEDYAIVRYRCNEDAFGFPFASAGATCYMRSWFPAILSKPQYVQSEEKYEKLDGENVVLCATIAKEYDLQTEYIPEEWHDKLIVALMCDHVYINGIYLNKSSDYSIDWDNYGYMDDGTKLAMATCKMQTNFNIRNSN